MANKIDSLTPEQEEQIPKYLQKWLSIGLDTKRADFKKAKEHLKAAYKIAGCAVPPYFACYKGPGSAMKDFPYISEICDNWSDKKIKAELKKRKTDEYPDGDWAQLVKDFKDEMDIDLDVRRNLMNDFLNGCIYGSHDAGWLAFYNYMLEVVGIKEAANLKPLMDLAECCGWVAPYDRIAIMIDKPNTIKLENEVAHCDGGPFVSFEDGELEVFCLHGVRVPKWLAVTPSEQLDPKSIFDHDLDNAQVRAEFVRKIGLDRLVHALDTKVIDSETVTMTTPHDPAWQCHYELLEFAYRSESRRRALKMPNPSVPELDHVEYVPNTCNTVRKAINFRLARNESDIDDENGADWYLQGDVIMRPKGVKKTKRWPSVIA